jgi:hypothetical protein
LGGIARGDDFSEAAMVIAWLKRVLEILNKTIAAADAVSEKPFLPAERFATTGTSFSRSAKRFWS